MEYNRQTVEERAREIAPDMKKFAYASPHEVHKEILRLYREREDAFTYPTPMVSVAEVINDIDAMLLVLGDRRKYFGNK